MKAQEVKARLLRQFEVADDTLFGGERVDAPRVEALVERTLEIQRLAVQVEVLRAAVVQWLDLDLAQAEVAVEGIQHLVAH